MVVWAVFFCSIHLELRGRARKILSKEKNKKVKNGRNVKALFNKNIPKVFTKHQTSVKSDRFRHELPVNCENDLNLSFQEVKKLTRFIKTSCLFKISEYRNEKYKAITVKNVLIYKELIIKNTKNEEDIISKVRIAVRSRKAHPWAPWRGSILGRTKDSFCTRREVYDFNAVKILMSNDVESNPGPNNSVSELIVA